MRANIDWTRANQMVRQRSHARAKKAAGIIRERVSLNCPVGTVNRPMYRSGPYAGQPWTARDAGQLKKSVRIVERDEDKYGFGLAQYGSLGHYGNVRVYAGTYLAFYAKIVEYFKPFMRPAVASTKGAVKDILENG